QLGAARDAPAALGLHRHFGFPSSARVFVHGGAGRVWEGDGRGVGVLRALAALGVVGGGGQAAGGAAGGLGAGGRAARGLRGGRPAGGGPRGAGGRGQQPEADGLPALPDAWPANQQRAGGIDDQAGEQAAEGQREVLAGGRGGGDAAAAGGPPQRGRHRRTLQDSPSPSLSRGRRGPPPPG